MVMEKSKRARASDAGGKEAKKAAVENGQAAPTMAEEKLAEFVEKMRKLHEEIEEVTDKATEEVLEVERSFVSQRRRPLYDKRKAVLDKIPHFWQNVLCNCGAIRHSTVEQDVKVLDHLTSLDVEECKEEGDIGYTITMTFSPNPFFSNETLTRSLIMQDELTLRVTGTRINWKEGQDYTAGIKAYVDDEEEEEEGEEGEEGKEQLVSLFSWMAFGDDDPISVANDDIGNAIRDDIWPNPIKYYHKEGVRPREEVEEEDDEPEFGFEYSGDEEEEGEEGEEGDDDEAEEADE